MSSPFSTNNSFSRHFGWAKNELKKIEDRKRDIIKELARRLESDDMPTERIAIEIANQLEGYASAQYVRKCLDSKYKLQSKVRQSQQQEEENEICETSSAKIQKLQLIVVNNDRTEEKEEQEKILQVQQIPNSKVNIQSKEFADIVNEVAQKTEQLLKFQSELKLKYEDIHTLKEENQRLREDLAKASFKSAYEYNTDPFVLQKRVNEQGKLLLPFIKSVQLQVSCGNILQVLAKVKPIIREVQVMLDEEEASIRASQI